MSLENKIYFKASKIIPKVRNTLSKFHDFQGTGNTIIKYE